MTLPSQLNVALKEWAIVCDALATGRQIILLRKGGIYESAGEFEIEHRRFALFPTYLHQKPEMLKPAERGNLHPMTSEPNEIAMTTVAAITDIVPVKNRATMDALDACHIWSPPLIDMRFNYRPENPLYLLLLRAYALPRAVKIRNTPAYAGCKSWVPLDVSIPTLNAMPALSDEDYHARQRAILNLVSG